jgi:hypothetical protein
VPDCLAVGREDHGIDGADRPRIARQLVEQRDDCLLTRVGNVEAGKAEAVCGSEQLRQRIGGKAKHVEID